MLATQKRTLQTGDIVKTNYNEYADLVGLLYRVVKVYGNRCTVTTHNSTHRNTFNNIPVQALELYRPCD